LAETRRLGVAPALARFLVKLDRMSRTALDAAERIALLREIKRPLLKLVASLPKPRLTAVGEYPTGTGEITLEQRLYCLTIKNLRQALADLDQSSDFHSAELDKARRWLLRNLFRFLDRQVRFGLLYGRSVPRFTWQTLHDLYSYVSARRLAMPRAIARRHGRWDDFDPRLAYRELLLLGLADSITKGRRFTPELIEEIAGFAQSCRLAEPDGFVGEFNVYRTDLSVDMPPQKVVGALTESFRGWVLIPGSGFFQCLQSEMHLDRRLTPGCLSSFGYFAR
jgi:hypothetical protein